MREILLKAKRNDNGEWIYWNILGELCRESGKRTRLAIQKGATTSYYDYIHQIITLIDKTTICRLTGLTDKNGNKIWENDIVTCCEKRGYAFFRCLVLWNQRKARFDVRAMNCNFPMTLDEWADDISINGLDYEVIGNIFDNAELLKE